ncbi:MAG: diguanylate cyclase [Alphaproteobacteria bacterium]|nr:diguanylate cyclase [Alphaproteobacteria bacterium]MCL2452093.1 diguanylate cyclase [Alphaproteobacteria bacterium]
MTRRIAIIDDVLPNALLLKGYVKRLGDVEGLTFTDPREALLRCNETAPDLVLLDYHMPLMSGAEFLEAFRKSERCKDVPVIMVTGEEKKDVLYDSLFTGANDFLRKPVDSIELMARARNLLELRARQLELAKANEQLYYLATTDSLTGLKNRRHFLECLAVEIERSKRYSIPCSVAIIDADRFKVINDNYGHDVGDQVLRELSKILLNELRSVDVVGRLGGEEFAVQFTETSKHNALEVCERILSRIRLAKVLAGLQEVRITASIGLSEVRTPRDSLDAVLKRADEALFRAKRSGRDRCEAA